MLSRLRNKKPVFQTDLAALTRRLLEARARVARERALLVGLSGIDAAGKGFLARRLSTALEDRAQRVALLGVDGWLDLPERRYCRSDPGRHFYEHALRLDEMFASLVLPLRAQRSLSLEMDQAEETATAFRRYRYELRDIDVILVEGIFLFKRAYQQYFDLRLWVDCSFETALQRALGRRQEGLSLEATRRAYETIYFPAQRLHLELDDPVGAASALLANDPGR